MSQSSNKKIISKYLASEASEAEIDQLLKWLERKKNQKIFKDYLKTKLLLDIKYDIIDSQEAFILLLDEIKLLKRNQNKNLLTTWFKYAAIFIGLAILTTYTLSRSDSGFSKITTSDITLEIDDNNIEIIEIDERKIIKSENGNEIGSIQNDVLTYKNNSTKKKKLAYNNVLSVPYGKQFVVQLADGTLIHLNAGSTLKYPSNFSGKTIREVFLEGEAYFIVAKDKNIPFIVKTENLDTRVYGTEFNVSAYPNDKTIEVVLVEGIVGIQEATKKSNFPNEYVMVRPSQKASIVKNLGGVKVENVNVNSYIAWKSGLLMFNDENIAHIFKKLERQFNIEIQNNYSELYKHSYTGVFKSENIDEILTTISAHTKFSYSKNGNKIIIKNY
ncbi:MAG: FecR family protein [Lutibacter sp.]|nr:FecR family protein [Lutibacter sp.]